MKYIVSLSKDPEIITGLKQHKCFPWSFAGIVWDETTKIECDDLRPYLYSQKELIGSPRLSNEQIIEYKLIDPRLIVIELTEDTHGGNSECEI